MDHGYDEVYEEDQTRVDRSFVVQCECHSSVIEREEDATVEDKAAEGCEEEVKVITAVQAFIGDLDQHVIFVDDFFFAETSFDGPVSKTIQSVVYPRSND